MSMYKRKKAARGGKERSSQTEPPSRFSATANQWIIYDTYLEELQKQEKNKEKQKTTLLKKDTSDSKKKVTLMETRRDDISKVEKVAKIVERAINRDLMDDKALSMVLLEVKHIRKPKLFYKHQILLCDVVQRPGALPLHPLWMFQYNVVRNLSVTALCWNNKYLDLFAVGLRSYECRQGDGMVLFFSMKNRTVPEYIYSTPSGVCSLDIHPHHSYLLAVGFYDGCVAVYNLKKKEPHPVDRSTVKNGRHTVPVWQVYCQKDDMDGNHIFYSVSADSRVVSWTLVKHKLISTDIIRLWLKGAASDAPHAAQRSNFCKTASQMSTESCDRLYLNVNGRSMDFNKQIDDLFLVGTEQGKIHKCSKLYSNLFLETYEAHKMPADTVKWNHFHPNIFISCSYDWTVKLWEHTINTPLLTIDLYEPVADVAWAPYSSTVFAAATIDGKVHVFDRSISTEETIHQQQVMEKETKPTRIEFNPIHPMIILADDKGNSP
ncbi:PREDICTED: dynein intermediate chain 1, axonemal [Cyprinodon variegatus]|uniref:dynein intermediate chain 1, axonemal n=1 Tax=Cyprinodon variegatus TaxID=28743 RepID=UPI000742AB0C|nr:PREDICTED: dynein intermediate chain 1, axonemal [Cyprinodon variegatus]